MRQFPALFLLSLLTLIIGISGCKKPNNIDDNCENFNPTPYTIEKPTKFPAIPDMTTNPLTIEGVALGKKLFYEKKLSGNGTQSCGSCHNPAYSFTDNGKRVSKGIDNIEGTRNSMSIVNMLWNKNFFWDGRDNSLEIQAHDPVVNPIEMNNTWKKAVASLQNSTEYPDLFCKAFGTSAIDSDLVTKAIAQFERTIISSNSKYDRRINFSYNFTESEQNGLVIYQTEKGDCFHCHDLSGMLSQDNLFHNNGLDAVPIDKGLGAITGNANDDGKFKTPTLRNIELTAPYMHDGRFATLEEVIDHYNSGGVPSATIDPLMKKVGVGLNLTDGEKQDLLNFLKCLTDSSVFTNPSYLE